MSDELEVAKAINRVADALFTQAKQQGRQVKTAERAVAVQESLLELQQVNLGVTKQLEARLAAQLSETP